ncbi:MAG: hypothetical protein KKD44_06455 [Proteobacteria bacterium]|nr:hypothetical protein [Pseudomonadota bacterium]
MSAFLNFGDLDPTIEKLLKFFGVVTDNGNLNSEWLKQPLERLRESVYERHALFFELLDDLLDSTDGQRQGMAGPNTGDTWYPVPGLNVPVLFITTREANGHLFIGLGLNWSPTGGDNDFSANVFANLPLIDVDLAGDIDFALGKNDSPVQLAFNVSHKDGFGHDIIFAGVKLSAQIYFTKSPEVSFQVQQLELPGKDPQDINLAQMDMNDPEQWVQLILSLVQAKMMGEGGEIERIAAHLLPIFGLTGLGPKIDWWDVPSQGTGVITQWLRSLLESSDDLDDWLEHWLQLINAPNITIQGTGTRIDPKKIKISLAPVLDLYFTMGQTRNAQGHLMCYPGLILATAGKTIGNDDATLNVQCRCELAEIPLGGGGEVEPLSGFDLCARLYRDGDDLVDTDFTASPQPLNILGQFKVKELKAGLALNTSGQMIPILELVNVTSAQGNWPSLDLTSGKAFLQPLADLADSLIRQEIQSLLGTDSPAVHTGKHLAALLGIIPPTDPNTPAPWPVKTVIDVSKLAAFLGNPLGAIACYHGDCIAQENNQAPLWRFLVSDLIGLLKQASIAAPAVTGTGDITDPWTVEIYSGAEGNAYLTVWAEVDQQSLRPQLDVALMLEPSLIGLGTHADLRLRTCLHVLHLSIPPTAQCPGPVNATWLESVSSTVRVMGKPELTVQTGLGLTVSVDWIELSCVWKQQNNFDWAVALQNLSASCNLAGLAPITLPSLKFGGGFDLTWNFPSLDIDLNIDLPDFGALLKLCLGSWLIERCGSFGFGLAGLLGLFPSINFQWPELPAFPNINLPDWNSGPFSFPLDWPKFHVGDWNLFFGNPWPLICNHLKLLFSKPSWAFPSLKFLGGSLFGSFPDFSLPDWGWGSGGTFEIPSLGSLPFSITGDGTYEIPWALMLDFDQMPPVELLVWLDPDGPPIDDWASVMISLVPDSWQDIPALMGNPAFSLSNLGDLLKHLEDLSPIVRRMMKSVGGEDFGHHLTALFERLRLSDGLVPYISQMPASDLPNWERPFSLNTLPEENHFAQLDQTDIVDCIEARINTYSGADSLPVLLLGAAWESAGAFQTVLGRFGNPDTVHFDMRQIGVDPDQIGLAEVSIGTERFFIGDIGVFNTAPSLGTQDRLLPVEGDTPGDNSQAKQVTRMVERMASHTGKKIILLAHSHSGLAALAAVQREHGLAAAQKKIAGLIIVGTPLINTPLVFAPEQVAIIGNDVPDLPADLDIKKAFDEGMAFLDRLKIGDLPGSSRVKDALAKLLKALNSDLGLPAVVNGAFPVHAFNVPDDLTVDIPACAIGSRLPVFQLKDMVLGWLDTHLNQLGGAHADYTAPTHVGFGIRYTDKQTLSDLRLTPSLRLDLCRLDLGGGHDETGLAPLPRLRLETDIHRVNGWLVGGLGENPRMRWAQLGISADPQRVVPTVVLHDTFLDSVSYAKAALTDVLGPVPGDAFELKATMQRLMHELIENLGNSSLHFDAFQHVCALLEHLDLVDRTGGEYGFKLDGWQALLADAEHYLINRLQAVANNASLRNDLFQTVSDAWGLDLRDFPAHVINGFSGLPDAQALPFKALFSSMNLLMDAADGYALDPGAWLDLLTNPKGCLEYLLADVLNDSTQTTPLMMAINSWLGLDDVTLPKTTVSYSSCVKGCFTSQGVYDLNLTLPAASLGGQVSLGASLCMDVPSKTFSVRISLGPAAFGLSMVFDLTFSLDYTLALITENRMLLRFGDASLPYGYDDLCLLPAPVGMADKLGQLLPRFVLNTALAALMENKVFIPHPDWAQVMVALGLARQTRADACVLMRPLDGLIQNPKTWLLSSLSLGSNLPGVSLDSLKVTQLISRLADAFNLIDGGGVIRLPYGLNLSCTENAGVKWIFETETPLALGDQATADISLSLTLSQTLSVGVTGDLDLVFTLDDSPGNDGLWNSIRVQAGYESESFTLSVGVDDVLLNLIPFGGWSDLADLAAQGGVRLLNTALDGLMTHLESDAANFVTAARNLLTAFDLDTVAKIDTMLDSPLTWLNTRMGVGQAATTLSGLQQMLAIPLGPGITISGSTLTFSDNDLALSLGRDNTKIGVWLTLDPLTLGPIELELSLGVETPDLSTLPDISLTLDLTTANDLITGLPIKPSLSLGLESSPFLHIYPLGDMFTNHQFRLSLLGGVNFSADPGIIPELIKNVLLPLALELVIDSQAVVNFLSNTISATVPVKPGDILVSAGLLELQGGSYNLTIPQTFSAQNLVYSLLASAMRAFSNQQFMDGVVSIVSKNRGANVMHYGLKVSLPDITVSDDPELVMHLGSDDADWIKRAGGPDYDEGGLVFYLPTVDESGDGISLGDIGLLAEIELVNLGIDISGKQDDPIVDAGGFRLGGVDIRICLVMTFGNTVDVHLGGSVLIDQIGLPLGSSSGNVIAQNMLSSDSGGTGDNTPVNPSFSIELSYYNDLDVRLLGRNAGEAEIWFPIQKTFGPIHVGQVGVKWYNTPKAIELLLDGGVSLAGLNVNVDDLGVKIPILKAADFSAWTLGLRGLGISYNEGGVKIAGALLRDNDEGTSYSGACLVEVSGKTFTAIGSYSKSEFTSMFVFVLLPIPIGGPPYLFITGLAGGFGYNRGLTVPGVESVPNFPLVEAARGSSAFTNDPLSALQQLGTSVPIQRGSYWVCGGIRFTSFELAKSVALVYVMLINSASQKGVEVGLIGMSQMSLPENKPLVNLEMALKARFSTIDGVFSVEARLSDNSWLLNRDCRLTGGFAFYIWFDGPYRGDFVITMGGYHPRFAIKSYYPDVPRLGFNWRVTSKVTIKGESYFALTASAVMAGGLLEASYKSGNLKAWYKAWANFLIAWKPFAYDIEMGISIGVSYRLKINLLFGTITKTFKVELGAEVWIWGPRFSGKAKVTWYIISFTVRFGAGDSASGKEALSWAAFRETFLPADEKMFNADVVTGMLTQEKDSDDTGQVRPWLLQPEFTFKTETVLGTNAVSLFGLDEVSWGNPIDIRPMHLDNIDSSHIITIQSKGGLPSAIQGVYNLSGHEFKTNTDGYVRVSIHQAYAPAALWEFDGTGEKPDAKVVDSIIGVTIIAEVKEDDIRVDKTGEIPVMELFERGYHPLPFTRELDERTDLLSFSQAAELVWPDAEDSLSILVAAGKVLGFPWNTRRSEVLDALEAHGARVVRGETQRATAEILGRHYVAPPKLASLYENMSLDAILGPDLTVVPVDPGVVVVKTPRKPAIAAVLRQRPEALKEASGRIRTSIDTVLKDRTIPRVTIRTRWSDNVAGARLNRVPLPTKTAATRVALTRSEFVCDAHRTAGLAKQYIEIESKAIQLRMPGAVAALRFLGEESQGVAVQSGTTQIWTLPVKNVAGPMPVIHFSGNQAIRVTAMTKSGALIEDREYGSGQGQWELPALTGRIALTGLGKCHGKYPSTSGCMGQVALSESVRGLAVIGWQVHSQFIQTGRLSFLGRGCMIRTGAAQLTRRRGKIADYAVINASELLGAQTTLTTFLPCDASLVAVHVTMASSTPVRDITRGLGLSVKGFDLDEPPTIFVNDRSALLVYTVKGFKGGENLPTHGSIGTTTGEGWQVAGVLAMKGHVDKWLSRLSKGLTSPLVENGPLSAAGVSRILFEVEASADNADNKQSHRSELP